MEHIFTTEGLISLLTLTFLEIVLGIDNIVFISLITGKIPKAQQSKVRLLGIGLALLARVILLLAVSWLIGLQKPIFIVGDYAISYRDIILFVGGLFLIGKSVTELHAKLETSGRSNKNVKATTFRNAVIQIVLIDLIFSVDSILTAIGLVESVVIIVIAIIVSLGVMLFFVRTISDFIDRHPAMKILAIAFLIMIGTLLVIEALHIHVPRGYIYFAMAFALGVEILNMKIRKKSGGSIKIKNKVRNPA
jgi:predicted tellurium resistance membrane protein TerC